MKLIKKKEKNLKDWYTKLKVFKVYRVITNMMEVEGG
jgi:hypothetical protein